MRAIPSQKNIGSWSHRIRDNHLVKRHLFGFGKGKDSTVQEAGEKSDSSDAVVTTDASVDMSTSTQPPPKMDEQTKLVQKYQFMMAQALSKQQLTSSVNGVTLLYTGDLHPRSVKISEDAMAKGSGEIAFGFHIPPLLFVIICLLFISFECLLFLYQQLSIHCTMKTSLLILC
jgi:hypothetical protein